MVAFLICGYVRFRAETTPRGQTELKEATGTEGLWLIGGSAVKAIYPPSKFQFVSLGVKTITGYSSTPEQTDGTPFITASNKVVSNGIIACPSYIEFGSVVMIDGNYFVCEDRMSAEKYPHRFDIWFETLEEAINWGIQKKEVMLVI